MKLSIAAHWDPNTNLEAARAWDRPGVHGVWIDETLWLTGALPMAAAIAASTERIQVGIGILNAYTQHPTYVAMHYAALAEISQGRGVIGIGSGVDDTLIRSGIEQKMPRTAVKETIEIARAMFAGGKVNYKGKFYSATDIDPEFEVDYPTPFYWGAMGDRSVGTAGEVADGWMISNLEPFPYVEKGMGLLRAGAEAAGRDPEGLEVIQYQVFACDEDSAKARAEAKKEFADVITVEFDLFRGIEEWIDIFAADLVDFSAADYLAMVERLRDGVPASEAVPDQLIEQISISGDPAECARQLRRFEEIGVTETVLKGSSLDFERIGQIVGGELAPLVA
jgi:5,10-methylenetetrahydromethanopterin reductase